LTQWYVQRVFDLSGNSYDSAGYRGDFYVVGQSDAAFGLFFVLVFANQDTFAYRLDYFKRFCFDLFFLSISPSSLQKHFILKYRNYYIFFNAVLQFLCYNTPGKYNDEAPRNLDKMLVWKNFL